MLRSKYTMIRDTPSTYLLFEPADQNVQGLNHAVCVVFRSLLKVGVYLN